MLFLAPKAIKALDNPYHAVSQYPTDHNIVQYF